MATCCCVSEPPEQPVPIVNLISPSDSTTRSLAMISDSACVTMLQLWPALSSAVDITAKPRDNAASSTTLGAVPVLWSIPQLAPCSMTSLWFQPGCGAHGAHGLLGS